MGEKIFLLREEGGKAWSCPYCPQVLNRCLLRLTWPSFWLETLLRVWYAFWLFQLLQPTWLYFRCVCCAPHPCLSAWFWELPLTLTSAHLGIPALVAVSHSWLRLSVCLSQVLGGQKVTIVKILIILFKMKKSLYLIVELYSFAQLFLKNLAWLFPYLFLFPFFTFFLLEASGKFGLEEYCNTYIS